MTVEKYLRIVKWARRRYTINGALTISMGGNPSIYARIERAAWNRHMSAATPGDSSHG